MTGPACARPEAMTRLRRRMRRSWPATSCENAPGVPLSRRRPGCSSLVRRGGASRCAVLVSAIEDQSETELLGVGSLVCACDRHISKGRNWSRFRIGLTSRHAGDEPVKTAFIGMVTAGLQPTRQSRGEVGSLLRSTTFRCASAMAASSHANLKRLREVLLRRHAIVERRASVRNVAALSPSPSSGSSAGQCGPRRTDRPYFCS